MSYTPGPWAVESPPETPLSVYGIHGNAKGFVRIYACDPGPDRDFTIAFARDVDADTRIANAQLIAAAPELLEACNAAKKYLERDLIEPGRTVFWNLVAAIAKAEGRS